MKHDQTLRRSTGKRLDRLSLDSLPSPPFQLSFSLGEDIQKLLKVKEKEDPPPPFLSQREMQKQIEEEIHDFISSS